MRQLLFHFVIASSVLGFITSSSSQSLIVLQSLEVGLPLGQAKQYCCPTLIGGSAKTTNSHSNTRIMMNMHVVDIFNRLYIGAVVVVIVTYLYLFIHTKIVHILEYKHFNCKHVKWCISLLLINLIFVSLIKKTHQGNSEIWSHYTIGRLIQV
jgi:hypothetical protein